MLLKYPLNVLTAPPVSGTLRDRIYSAGDADVLIKGREVQWLVCIETYQENRRRVIDSQWMLDHGDDETCVYVNNNRAIIGFRGTAAPKDLYDDILIMQGKVFPRAQEAVALVSEMQRLNPHVSFEVTGHSLGGAAARETAKSLGLKATTFNAAGPPSNPVQQAQGEVAYHIAFDIISAWQSPNLVRIDKGFRPTPSLLTFLLPALWLENVFSSLVASHALTNFSNETPGTVIPPCAEKKILNDWTRGLPISRRGFLIQTLTGKPGSSLPGLD